MKRRLIDAAKLTCLAATAILTFNFQPSHAQAQSQTSPGASAAVEGKPLTAKRPDAEANHATVINTSDNLPPLAKSNHKKGEPEKTAVISAPLAHADDAKNVVTTRTAATPISDVNNRTTERDAASAPNTTATIPSAVNSIATATATSSPSSIYRVGIGDVLDIRLLNATTRQSTLYTVMSGGILEYPLAGEPFTVGGLTLDEIKARLVGKIKLYDHPQIAVSVRDYASHSVIITGLVDNAGSKALRREAVPLYVLLTEAVPRAGAVRAVVTHDKKSTTVDLANQNATSVLIYPGDFIRLLPAPPTPPPASQFFYIGGQISAPGQKNFHKGLTLSQAILAAGGTTHVASGKVKIYRQKADGRLTATEYNLKQIQTGNALDPQLQAGDRIDIGRGRW